MTSLDMSTEFNHFLNIFVTEAPKKKINNNCFDNYKVGNGLHYATDVLSVPKLVCEMS